MMFKQYNYMRNVEPIMFESPPFDFDYNILGLSKKRIFNMGELNRIDYYGYLDSDGNYRDLILTEYREFFRKNGIVYLRRMKIDWYLEDDSVGATKTTLKHYSPEESLKLGERRRRNVISDLKINTVGLIQMVSGITQIDATKVGLLFMGKITNEITQYIEGIEDPLKNKILTCSEEGCEWIDNEIPNMGGFTVRQYLYSSINIDYSDLIYVHES